MRWILDNYPKTFKDYWVLLTFIILPIAGIVYFYELFWLFLPFVVIAITAGTYNHRAITHNSLVLYPWAQHLMSWVMILTYQEFSIDGSVQGHRDHHRYTDTDRDPHPSLKSLFNGRRSYSLWYGTFTTTGLFDHVTDWYHIKQPTERFYVRYQALLLPIMMILLFLTLGVKLALYWICVTRFAVFCSTYSAVFPFHYDSGVGEYGIPTNRNWLWVLAESRWHKNHHDRPWIFNQADPGGFDLYYYLLKPLAKRFL